MLCFGASCEHDFVEEEKATELKEPSVDLLAEEPTKSEHGNIVWKAKMILMSRLIKNALEELSSEKSSDDRISHICNILWFALLKKDQSFMTLVVNGILLMFFDHVIRFESEVLNSRSVDDTSLIQTAHRYAKDVTQLDLKNCRHWNCFLEPVKRAKISELLVKEQDSKSETLNTAQPDDDKTKVKEEDKSVDHVVEVKMEDETNVVKMEDEDPEEEEEMEESGMQHDLPNVKKEE
ncbi:hypothetical protein SO802_011396 [Lithocarpus litseifolius]|uniref:DBC1/CARP1 catalytically inactive NUDIX hydrolase domain-containing protein n=1 Tax=Lithocarpus litseifolius TaxID=425828 RepID=A0AAW2D3Z5_9ROSI